MADYFDVEIPSKALKDCILSTIKDRLVQLGVLPAAVEGSDAVSASTPTLPAVFPQVSPEQSLKFVRPVIGMSLTFEQQKELLTLQHNLEMERGEKAQERAQVLRAQAHAVELEKLKCTTKIREAELFQQREQQQVERYKLDLLKEGKMVNPALGKMGVHGAGGSLYFDVSICLRLVPKFSEWDPNTFFLLFEQLARNRNWSDSEQTLLLQCVLTGKAQEAYSALSMI